MQTTTLLTLICAALVLALVALAVYTRRSAESACANGYDQGYDDAKRAAYDRTAELNYDITRLQELASATRAEHARALETTILDCDARIAIYSARALTSEDITTLRIVNQQLLGAAQTYHHLQALDKARFANTAVQRLGKLIDRLADVMQKGPDHIEGVLTMAPDVAPNGKSWLVHGPQGCGKTSNARAEIDGSQASVLLPVGLSALANFISEDKALVWGNGSSFDNVIVRSALDACGIGNLWHFWNDRDLRTLLALYPEAKQLPLEGTKHHALDDAMHEAKQLLMALNIHQTLQVGALV